MRFPNKFVDKHSTEFKMVINRQLLKGLISIAQWLRVRIQVQCTAPTPSRSHPSIHNSSSRGPNALFCSLHAPAQMCTTQPQTDICK